MDISKIEASLSHGGFLTGQKLAVIYVGLVVPLLFPLITVMVVITALTGGMEWEGEVIGVLIGCNILGALLFSFMIWLKRKNDKLKSKIILWMEDTIELTASVARLDGFGFKPYQVQFDFEIDGKNYYRISPAGNSATGWQKVFAQYANKEIKILYSPKYDEVLILDQIAIQNG